ncbi:DDX46 [Lepeophtheirus salmonis]|uniref:DDX46 n=1 Tax=Lepeophtheirus salmonis TaxID=72036 RepID=A0A7R8CH27_LEPSM|nr:DDX46 [Lepeophtheirus salmonis]CAF2776063.1 DDX46 [Lepeophtheirus salmonis]
MWSLEDDTDDEEDESMPKGRGEEEEEEEEEEDDPLESYMKEVNKEVRKLKGVKGTKTEKGSGGVVIMTGVAKKRGAGGNAKRGELIEQNQDGLEYSSEDDEDNLDDAMSQLAKKRKKRTY